MTFQNEKLIAVAYEEGVCGNYTVHKLYPLCTDTVQSDGAK